MNAWRRKARGPRSGMVLVFALVIMVVAILLSADSVRTVLTDIKLQRQTQLALQADWLASAGLDRAESKLALDSAYAGETWQVPGPRDRRGIRPSATVEITIIRAADRTRVIEVTAVYPAGARLSAYATKSMMCELPRAEE